MEDNLLLVVDDELEICGELTVYLSRKGYDVLSSTDPREALDIYRRKKPMVVVTDYSMPGMNGIQLMQGIKSLNAAAQVIFVSGKADIQTAVQAMKKDAFDFLLKPIDLHRLERLIQQAQERRNRDVPAEKRAKRGYVLDHEIIDGRTGEISVLHFNTSLDEFNAPRVSDAFRQLLRDGTLRYDVIFLLSEVKYINNVGLNLLIELHDRLASERRRVVLCEPSEPVDGYLRTLGYNGYFKMETSLALAAHMFTAGD